MTGRQDAWQNIFAKYKLLDKVKRDSYADISANEIKAVDGKEPRIMTKVDCREMLPTIMSENGLSILAIRNGLYRIAKTDPFIDIEEEVATDIIEVPPPANKLCLNPFDITRESAALDLSAVSGILTQVFGEAGDLVVRGRIFGDINFLLDEIAYDVKGVQIEVDGGYEGDSSINLIEAKNSYRSNISIRQLLYPQLYWQKEVNNKKAVRCFVLYHQGELLRYIPYVYKGDGKGYADHANEKAFRFTRTAADFSLSAISEGAGPINTKVPFPQADKFEKVDYIIVTLGEEGGLSKSQISTMFNMVSRQIDYYTNTLRWMGLATMSKDGIIKLTDKGKEIARLSFHKRMRAMAKIIFSDPIFNRHLKGRAIDEKLLSQYEMSGTTIPRRLKTVDAWVNYFQHILEDK